MNVDPALQAKQLQLKKIKLADVLNDKLAHRPGPLQLLQEGIIEPQLSQVVRGVDVEDSSPPNVSPIASMVGANYPPTTEAGIGDLPAIALPLNFSRQLGGRHSIAGSSPSADLIMDASPFSVEGSRTRPTFGTDGRKFSDSSISPAPSPRSMDDSKSPDKSPREFNSSYPPIFKPALSPGVMSTSSKSTSSPAAIRKKQQKKYRKLRYHEYIPPSKSTPKGGKTNPKPPSKSDSPYTSILAQQQLLLQLQVLHQQYPNGVLMQKIPEMINTLSKEHKSLAVAATKGTIATGNSTDPSLTKQFSQPQVVPVEVPNKYNTSSVRFEDLKVSDLKAACKELGMIISGKKAELVDRLMDHNKGVLPAMALPENFMKESRRQAFSLGQCSIDSQVSNSTMSPTSPTSSPVFQFPSDRGLTGTDSGTSGSGKAATANHSQLAELHKEFNEMFERQKRNYICHKGVSMEKSIAPRPELSELLNFKLSSTSGPSPPPPPPPPLSSFASLQLDHQQQPQQQQRTKGNSLPRTQVLVNSMDARANLSASDSLSRSMPSSPNPGSPHQLGNQNSEIMDSTSSGADYQDENKASAPIASTLSSISQTASTGASAIINSTTTSTVNGGGMMTFANSMEPLGRTGMGSGDLGPNATFYQQQQARLQSQTATNRHGRASLPAPSGLHSSAIPLMSLPSYNSVMRSRSIAGMQPNMASVAGQMTLNK